MSGFKCKQFYVAHDRCAMKVSTDSLMLGSWVTVNDALSLLDIGTGSGLLALMLLQRTSPEAQIDCVDIDENAVEQARENIANSPWSTRARVWQADIQSFQHQKHYDLIISNPPYFNAHAASKAYEGQSKARTLARQQNGFSIDSLMTFAQGHLAKRGKLCCMYPASLESDVTESARRSMLYPAKRTRVRHNELSQPYLTLFEFTLQQSESIQGSLTIRERDGAYTQQYKALCRDYYLTF